MKKYKKIEKPIEQKFTWHPVTDIPEDFESPIIFLTDKGAMVTHKSLLAVYKSYTGEVKKVNTFLAKASYANAVAWIYQKELIPDSLEYVKPTEKVRKRAVKRALCIVGFGTIFIPGEKYRYSVQRTSGRITVRNSEGYKVEYPNKELMKRNFEIVELTN